MARAGACAHAIRRGLRLSAPRNSLARRFALPAAIALATVAGLAAGLIGDGAWDVAACAGLALPVLAGANALRTR